jgi:HK97 family phage prohead protease
MTHAAQDVVERSSSLLFCRAAAVEGSVDETARTIDYVASTEDIDGHGTIVRQNWRLERFKPQGVVLYAHDDDELPIGTATCAVEGGQLRARVKFSTADLNPMAEQVWLNVKAGVIRGISPGFIPHTITCETLDDRMVCVLDDNELYELSVTPCPSNANAMAQMRTRAMAAPRHELTDPATPPAPPSEETPPLPSDGPAVNAQPPIPEVSTMAEITQPAPTNINTVSMHRALGLPAGATEQDGVAACVRLRELEVQVATLTAAPSTAEAMGALRAMKADADRCKAAEAELAKVKAERDTQNFEVLIAQGRTDRKLSLAEEQHERGLFERACKEGRGNEQVENLRGLLKIKSPTIPSRDVKQPETRSGAALTWNGKAYKDLSYTQRAALKREDAELFRAMKSDDEAATV